MQSKVRQSWTFHWELQRYDILTNAFCCKLNERFELSGHWKNRMKFLVVVKTMILVVFLGWLLMWILLSTKTYRDKWSIKLLRKLTSTSPYFGNESINLLLFMLPMMLLAVLGCIQMHLQKKSNSSSSNSAQRLRFWDRLATTWRRPILVMTPLGIVSITELAFTTMFILLLIWSLATYLQARLGFDMSEFVGFKKWQLNFSIVAAALAYLGNICVAFLFFPVTRGSSIFPLIGLTSEASIKYHIWLGNLSVVLFTLHGVGYVIYFVITNQAYELLDWNRHWVSNVAGEIAAIFGVIMLVTSLNPVRRKKFEVFFYTHHLYTLFIFFYILHINFAYFCTVLPGIFLFLIDRYLRFLQSRQQAQLVSARILPCDTVELNFSKTSGLKYNPTSILFVNIPTISRVEWHPFTVISNCNLEQESLSIVVKNLGNWSQKLIKELSSVDRLHVSVEGPYSPSSHFLRHQMLVMIGGGSGITPLISIIREIIYQTRNPNHKIPNILLICAFKNSTDLSMLNLLLPQSKPHLDLTKIFIQIEAYITREPEQQISEVNIKNITFNKEQQIGSPISPVLGKHSWLCLSSIISSSFVMYILLLGMVTRLYIYPIDGKEEMNYHMSLKALWNMFLVCFCIVFAASSVFLWSKRQAALEEEKLSGSWSSRDTELEDGPYESCLSQATKVHFGRRPDLKKILLDCTEPDVGVLVSGPSEMRHEVAKICRSNSAHNLHFESISFNW